MLGALPQSEFRQLIDRENPVMQLLLAHTVAIKTFMYPIKAMEWSGRDMGRPNRKVLFRAESFLQNIPAELKSYLDWPLQPW